MPNALQHATSPYLRQHAQNPVHWQEWGTAAFEEARRRDVPLLISIGYAACHWCHVMAHESFADPAIAGLLNDGFVSIKVDREERPDVDAVYMAATVAMTGHGGWPMTVFATPDGQPFYCGTYFPPTPRQGMPSFAQLLQGVRDAWTQRREQAVTAAATVAEHIRRRQLPDLEPAGAGRPIAEDLDVAVQRLAGVFDEARGGFGGAPKFPPATLLPALCRARDDRALPMAARTMTAMAYGGIYDQLAGGFCRYSVDAGWVVPHFEKMLYDNALLLSAYAAWIPHDESGLAARVAGEIVDFLENDLRTGHGGYAASLDADTEGVEGLTYVWTPHQLVEVLGADAAAAARLLRVTDTGTFEHGASTLQLAVERETELPAQWPDWRRRLLAARSARPQPARDDKIVTAWNALAISGLCDLHRVTGEARALDAARRLAGVLTQLHLRDGRLVRASIDGVAGATGGMLEDYACLAAALFRLHLATAERGHLEVALRLIDAARQLFAEEEALYADAPRDSELIHRPAEVLDNPTPAGIAALADAFALAHAIVGSAAYAEELEQLLSRLRPVLVQAPNAAGTVWRVAEHWAAGMPTYVVAGPAGEKRDALVSAVRPAAARGALVLVGDDEASSPLLTGRVGSHPRLFVCRGGVCDRPVAQLDEVRAVVSSIEVQ